MENETLTQAEREKLDKVLRIEGVVFEVPSLRIRDGILWLRVKGDIEAGKAAVKALLNAGVNQVIDNDFSTNENRVIAKVGAEYCTVWIDFVDGQLFR